MYRSSVRRAMPGVVVVMTGKNKPGEIERGDGKGRRRVGRGRWGGGARASKDYCVQTPAEVGKHVLRWGAYHTSAHLATPDAIVMTRKRFPAGKHTLFEVWTGHEGREGGGRGRIEEKGIERKTNSTTYNTTVFFNTT